MSRASLLMSTAVSTVVLGVPSAYAQTERSKESLTLEEVIVTAQKRRQVLLDVPQSVSVVDGGSLERQQASSFQDYLKLVPGLQLTQDQPGVGRLVLRGVNTGGVASTVAVYVDETPFGSSSGLVNGAILAGDFDTFDMERIEVLRGPQGTLYGASSLGGVLKFVTNPPQTEKFEARVRTSVESLSGGDIGYSGVGMLNVPVSETFAIRATGYYREQGGFIDSIGTAGSDRAKDINDSESYGGRVSALFTPSDAVSVRLTAIMQDRSTNASTTVESNATTLKTLYGTESQSRYVPEYTDIDYRLYNATADFDLGFATLTSSTSYNELDEPFRADLTAQLSGLLAGPFGPNELYQDQTTGYEKTTQELRLASPTSDTLEWLIGGYYTKEEGKILQDIQAVIPGTLTPIAGLPVLANLSLRSNYKEYALFATGTVHFNDMFDLTLGARYSENDQDARQLATGILAAGVPPVAVSDSSEDVVTYSIAPKYKLSDHSALYARVSTGFRPGGPNVLPPNPPANVPRTYDSDEVTSYEVGFKTESSDRAVTFDLAFFHIDWEDIQLFAQVNNFGVNINGGQATSDGLEFTLSSRMASGLSLSLNGAYTDTELQDDTNTLTGGYKGDELPYTPELSINANADYEWSIGAQSTAYVGGSVRYLSDQTAAYNNAFRVTNGHQREISSYEVVDLQAGVDFGRYSIELYAKNVTDSDGRTSAAGVGAYPAGAIGTGIIRPRTLGITFGFSFE
jgi:outer membrane receptor protein involved in Fe transport